MKDLGIKGTVYDIFGYLLPGLLLLFLLKVAYNHSQGEICFCFNVQGDRKISGTLTIALLLIVSYCIGHAISSVSSLLVEKMIVERILFLKKRLDNKNLLSKRSYSNFEQKYKELYKGEFNDRDFTIVVCHVQQNSPVIYSTAFVFLSFYGMARNIAFSMTIFLLCEIINYIISCSKAILIVIIISFLFMIAFYYEYYRFKKYYKTRILSGFLIS